MKQGRRPTRRKPSRQPKKKVLPQTSPPSGDVAALAGKVSNAVLDPIGTPEGPLPLRDSNLANNFFASACDSRRPTISVASRASASRLACPIPQLPLFGIQPQANQLPQKSSNFQ